jgi:hypothetical protein
MRPPPFFGGFDFFGPDDLMSPDPDDRRDGVPVYSFDLGFPGGAPL